MCVCVSHWLPQYRFDPAVGRASGCYRWCSSFRFREGLRSLRSFLDKTYGGTLRRGWAGQGIIPQGVNLESASTVRDPMHLPYDYDDFIPCLSVRAKVRDDAPTMEAMAVTLAMWRLTRSISNHAHRHVFLLDAKALLFALRKGRSSSRAFKLHLQKIGALVVCADILPYCGYIPTSCNPGDPPSRGLKRTLPRLRKVRSKYSSWQEHSKLLRRSLRHLRASPLRGMPESLQHKGSYDSSSSDSRTVQLDTAW